MGAHTENGVSRAIDSPVKPSKKTSVAASSSFLAGWEGRSEFVFQAFILILIFILAFSMRLFSVLRFESVIHEFDPWFNFRSTKYLVSEGFYSFHNWFDEATWYPLGRYIGGTVYPGLMWTAAVVHQLANWLRFTVNIRNVCVFTAPFWAGNTAFVTYLLTKEAWSSHAGIIASMFISVVPGYMSRSVAGSYDNEAVAIFALLFTFFMWVKAVKTGSLMWAGASALAYFYMVAAWGGYIFIINLIPAHVFVLLIAGRYSHRLYVSYCVFYIVGTLLSMQISFVSYQPVSSPEHFAAFGVFGLLQAYNGVQILKRFVTSSKDQKYLFRLAITAILGLLGLFVLAAISGVFPSLTGRLLSLIGMKANIAIVKSVSEHQPTSWGTYFFDMHMLVWLAPAGLYFCFQKPTDQNLFIILYCLFAVYFSGIMIRLMLVLAPVCCILGGIAASETLSTYSHVLFGKNRRGKRTTYAPLSRLSAVGVLTVMVVLFGFYQAHCTWVTQTAYSSPSIVLAANNADGSRTIFDDFREAYHWLSHNTDRDAKIMSWWDYGYQITGMGNRTTIVDNNTRNNTHIATVGLAMASTEQDAYPILQRLEVDYVLVVFGGMIGYSSDDINKFLWMVRISSGTYPRIQEGNYFNARGQYDMGRDVSPTMKNCIMYKMCYNRFAEVGGGGRTGYDRVRRVEIGEKNIKLTHLEEAFTTEHWMVRIYRVKKPHEIDRFEAKSYPWKEKTADGSTKRNF